MENDKSQKNINCFNLIVTAVLLLCSSYSLTLPITNTFYKMSWIMKVIICGSILCGVALYVLVIVNAIKKERMIKSIIMIFCIFPR